MALHNHLLLNALATSPPKDGEKLKQWLRDLVSSIDMKIIMGPMAHFVDVDGNKGLTAIVGIETSHISIHVWDEPVPAVVRFDLYTCGELPVKRVIDNITKEFGLIDVEYVSINRENGFRFGDGFLGILDK